MKVNSLVGITTEEVIKVIVKTNHVKSLHLREYNYPALTPGCEPAQGDKLTKISANEFLKRGGIQTLIDKLEPNRNVGIESLVSVKGKYKHIPMMDMSVKKSTKTKNELISTWDKTIIPRFGKGVLIETYNSYHFLGTEKLLTNDEFRDFLSWSLLCTKNKGGNFKTYVDTQYVAYCQLKGSCCLRISAYPGSLIPKTIHEFK